MLLWIFKRFISELTIIVRHTYTQLQLEAGHSKVCITHTGHLITFLHFVTCDLDLWSFGLILIGEWGIVTDYPCAKFGDCTFSCFGFIVQTNTHTESQMRLNAVLKNVITCHRKFSITLIVFDLGLCAISSVLLITVCDWLGVVCILQPTFNTPTLADSVFKKYKL